MCMLGTNSKASPFGWEWALVVAATILAVSCRSKIAEPEAGQASTATSTSSAPTQPRSPLRAVWGRSPENVWAVGDEGAIAFFDGKAWSDKERVTKKI